MKEGLEFSSPNHKEERTEKQKHFESLSQQISVQFQFACKMAEIEDIPLADALLTYTQIYRKLLLPRPFSSENPTWKEFAAGLETTNDPVHYIICFLTEISSKRKKTGNTANSPTQEVNTAPEKDYGPFAFDYDEKSKSIQLHVTETSENAPLSPAHFENRLLDLKQMFADIKKNYPEAQKVIGGSWLFSVGLGKGKILPPEFIANMRVVNEGFTGGNVWGQFLSGNGEFRHRFAQRFLENLKKAQNREELFDAIPYKNMETECDIQAFYDFYSI